MLASRPPRFAATEAGRGGECAGDVGRSAEREDEGDAVRNLFWYRPENSFGCGSARHGDWKALVGAAFSQVACLIFLLASTTSPALAQAMPSKKGNAFRSAQSAFPVREYPAGGGGGGTLLLEPGKAPGTLAFVIQTERMRDTCAVSGELAGNGASRKTSISSGDGKESCEVELKHRRGGAIEVSHNSSDVCRSFCGMRGSFDWTFMRPADGCSSKSVAGTRAAFKVAYDSKNYRRAYETLAPALRRCTATLSWFALGEITNDVAITLYHLQRPQDCVRVLKPLIAEVEMVERLDQPPVDAAAAKEVASAARTNLNLCERRAKGKV